MEKPNYRLTLETKSSIFSYVGKAQIIRGATIMRDNEGIEDRTFCLTDKPSCTGDCSCDNDCRHHCYCDSACHRLSCDIDSCRRDEDTGPA
jgi:hypothetical protein